MLYQNWQRYVETLLPAGKTAEQLFANADDPQLSAELYEFMFSQVVAGYLAWLHADPKYPQFWPAFGQLLDQGIPSPDFTYHLTPLEDDGVYRLFGDRGTVYIVDVQLASGGLIPRGDGPWGATIANYDGESLGASADGIVDVMFSRARPEGYTGEWRELPEGTTYMLIRQISYDWANEVDGRFTIDRLDTPAIRPRPTAAQIDANLKQMSKWLENWTRTSIEVGLAGLQSSPPNGFSVKNWFTESGGISTQQYMEGSFQLAADEALILEVELPKTCRYWSFHLADELWRTLDSYGRQGSLNGHMAVVDDDGKFRAVISEQDPGVPNWLDTSGYRKGLIYGRWKDCDKANQPVTKKVKLAELRDHLPATTPVVTQEARDASIRIRRRGAQMRRNW